MKTRAAAIHGFAASFGIPAYNASSVPDGAKYPYLTYSVQMPSWGSGDASLQLHLWHGGSEAQANAKAEEISASVGIGGVRLRSDAGAVWVKQGSPLWYAANDTADVRHRVINLSIETLC